MSTYANQTKNASTFANDTKASTAFKTFLRHGKEPRMEELADYVFGDVVFQDGTILENVTFAQLLDVAWNNQTKN